MKKSHYSSLLELLLLIPGSIIAFALLIALLAKGLHGLDNTPATTPSVDLKPVAQVSVAEPNAAAAAGASNKSGDEVVKAVCVACHATGALNAPKIGDKAAWQARIAQGYSTLVQHAIQGIRQMPARGGNPSLTDKEIGEAVKLMANQSGANF